MPSFLAVSNVPAANTSSSFKVNLSCGSFCMRFPSAIKLSLFLLSAYKSSNILGQAYITIVGTLALRARVKSNKTLLEASNMSDVKGNSRKIRSDKKHSIAPYVPDVYRIWIHRIARHVEISEGDVGALLLQAAAHDEECIRFFVAYFKRNFSHNSILFLGNEFAASIDDYIKINGSRDRFKVRVNQKLYERISDFQIALKTPYLAHATHALLRYALHTRQIVNQIAPSLPYDDIFKNAAIPKPHNKIELTELAFPKNQKSSEVSKKTRTTLPSTSKVTSLPVETNGRTVDQEEKSVWSVLK